MIAYLACTMTDKKSTPYPTRTNSVLITDPGGIEGLIGLRGKPKSDSITGLAFLVDNQTFNSFGVGELLPHLFGKYISLNCPSTVLHRSLHTPNT